MEVDQLLTNFEQLFALYVHDAFATEAFLLWNL
jgi:hypothetical protein